MNELYKHKAINRLPIFVEDALDRMTRAEYKKRKAEYVESGSRFLWSPTDLNRWVTQIHNMIEHLAKGLCDEFDIPPFSNVSPSELANWRVLFHTGTKDYDKMDVRSYIDIYVESIIWYTKSRDSVEGLLGEIIHFDALDQHIVDPKHYRNDLRIEDGLFWKTSPTRPS